MEDDKRFKVKIVVQDGCPPCEMIKQVLKEEVEQGKVELVQADSPEGEELSEKLGINATPTPVVIDEESGEMHKCELRFERDDLVIHCKGETEEDANQGRA